MKYKVGDRIGRWTIVGQRVDKRPVYSWPCKCDCGREKMVREMNLKSGRTLSCGCIRTYTNGRRRHGGSDTPEHTVWKNMRARCSKENHKDFHHYGGRGITVCERWLDFANFREDMGPRPFPKAKLERVDNDLGYGPDNCVWATQAQQVRNTRRSRFVEIDGRSMCITDWCREYGITIGGVHKRMQRGMSVEDAITTPRKI